MTGGVEAANMEAQGVSWDRSRAENSVKESLTDSRAKAVTPADETVTCDPIEAEKLNALVSEPGKEPGSGVKSLPVHFKRQSHKQQCDGYPHFFCYRFSFAD